MVKWNKNYTETDQIQSTSSYVRLVLAPVAPDPVAPDPVAPDPVDPIAPLNTSNEKTMESSFTEFNSNPGMFLLVRSSSLYNEPMLISGSCRRGAASVNKLCRHVGHVLFMRNQCAKLSELNM